MVFDSVSYNIDEVLLINLSANVFVFGDFNSQHKDLLTYSGKTDRSGKLCYYFSISNNLTQMVNFPTQIPDCDFHSPALLDLFLSSYASISLLSLVPLTFYQFQGAPFHHIAYVAVKRDSTSLVSTLLNQNLFQFAINE